VCAAASHLLCSSDAGSLSGAASILTQRSEHVQAYAAPRALDRQRRGSRAAPADARQHTTLARRQARGAGAPRSEAPQAVPLAGSPACAQARPATQAGLAHAPRSLSAHRRQNALSVGHERLARPVARIPVTQPGDVRSQPAHVAASVACRKARAHSSSPESAA
jgi:hypothetical protein